MIPDTDPLICQHCKQYHYECTFYLPISETRFKKKKMEEALIAAGGDGSASSGSATAAVATASAGVAASLSSAAQDSPSPREVASSSTKDVKILGALRADLSQDMS